MKKVWSLGVLMAAVLLATGLMFGAAPVGAGQHSDNEIPGRYIVLLTAGGDTAGKAGKVGKNHGLDVDLVYTTIHGAALRGAAGKLKDLQDDPDVVSAEPDRFVALIEPVNKKVDEQLQDGSFGVLHGNNFETLTTGIDRIDADLNPRPDVSAIGVAIIDTGIWLTHVDLNARAGKNCVFTAKSSNDDNGHGTHVAGIAAAKTNDNKGVRGVAPNAVLWAVKVLNRNGSGWLSGVICGVDWVTANAGANGIRVANMSLGFQGTSSALNTAITNSVASGVTYAVAAGNSSADASTFSPANHPDVITVSAMGDSDGKCGAAGPATSNGPDDTFATFSNFGSVVEIAAPGVDILSTWKGDKDNPGGLYATASGTSMASPHVAGAAAQYKATNPGASPSTVRDALIAAGIPQGQACGVDATGRERGGFTGDSDGIPEPLADAASL